MTTQGLKRSAPCENEQLEDVKAVVLNLEGSTIPRSFIEVRIQFKEGLTVRGY